MKNKEKLLLHICCGVCGAWVAKELSRDFEVSLYFFNPNIWPEEEYKKRLDTVDKVSKEHKLSLISGDYCNDLWLEAVAEFKDQPEGGKRCEACFDFRLGEAARYAKENDFYWFASTLTVGRNKRAEIINPIGKRWAKDFGVNFLDRDFKKEGGQENTNQESKKLNLYRQNYCGCIYSLDRH